MPKLYTRNQGGNIRYYGDLRDIGGGQVALKPPGSNRATSDETEALLLLAREIEKLEGRPTKGSATLGASVEEFVRVNPGEVTEQWLHDVELRLTRAVEFFGSDRELTTIEPKHLREWLNKKLPRLAGSTQRHFLHALSSLYRYAQEQGYVPVGFNPV
jgi:hypothetical protein